MLGLFFGERKSSEQMLKAKEIYGKMTKAGKAWSLLKAKSTIREFLIISCFKVLSRITNRQQQQALQTERDKL